MNPRLPLRLAEAFVDYPRIDTHITQRRLAVERAITPAGIGVARSIIAAGAPAQMRVDAFSETLARALFNTYVFGYREAAAELARQRHSILAAGVAATTFTRPPADPAGASSWLRDLTRATATAYAERLVSLNTNPPAGVRVRSRTVYLDDRARREAHNVAIGIVTRVLNAGRTAGALGSGTPLRLSEDDQTITAMRSEQLDEHTCDACVGVHGDEAVVDSDDYYDLLPPSYCFGEGRCRGIMIYSDDPALFQPSVPDFAAPATPIAPSDAKDQAERFQRSKAAKRGWRTRRRRMRALQKARDKRAAAARKGWRTRRRNH